MRLLRFIPLLLLLALIAAFAWRLAGQETPAAGRVTQEVMLGKAVPALTLAPLDGESVFSTDAFRGKPYLLNIFASWCAACALEHERLQRFAARSGLPLYGIAWKDDAGKLRQWLQKHGNNYALIGMDNDGAASLELGITGAPETYLVDADGRIAALYRGALSDSVINADFLPALQRLSPQGMNR